nr:uncharacterized protein LOC124808846 [Hydra vulgaris]
MVSLIQKSDQRMTPIKTVFLDLNDDPTQKDKTRAEAFGLLTKMEQLETVILIIIRKRIFEKFNQVIKKLQFVEFNLGMVEELYNSLEHYMLALISSKMKRKPCLRSISAASRRSLDQNLNSGSFKIN